MHLEYLKANITAWAKCYKMAHVAGIELMSVFTVNYGDRAFVNSRIWSSVQVIAM